MNTFSDATRRAQFSRKSSANYKKPVDVFLKARNSHPSTSPASCTCGGGCPACQEKSNGINISQPSDAAEIEADQLADKAMRMPAVENTIPTSGVNSSGVLQRKFSDSEYNEEGIQRKSVASGSDMPSQSPAHVSNALSSGGRPLDNETRNFFEPRLGHDFGNVRVHTDSVAHYSAKAIHAKAYTLGNNIVFGSGEYKPESESGKHLLAHELAHVTQSETSSNIRRDTIYRQPDHAQILAEIQMLRMQLMAPVNPLRPMQEARLIQLQAMLNQTTGKPAAPTKPNAIPTKTSVHATGGNADNDFYASLDDMTQLELDEMHRQMQGFQDMARSGLANNTFQQTQTPQAPQTTQSGCHVDPFVRSTGGTACGGGHHKQADQATRVSQKAMQMPVPDFSAEKAKERSMLDRLNAAHLAWKQTSSFLRSSEFSPYEIQKDRIIPLWKRWDLFEKSDQVKDSIQNPVEYYFRYGNEYIQEKERRITMRPFKARLDAARQKARSESNYWYSANEANERMTGDDLWRVGFNSNLFIESEKALVYKEQGSLQQLEREEREARQAQDRRNFEIQQYRNHVARGEQLSSPTTVIQPFAMAAFGAPVAAIYGGMQMGFTGAEAYHACKDGFSGDCALSLAPVVATAVVHQAIKPKAPMQAPTTRPNTRVAPNVKPNVVQPMVKPTIAEPTIKPTVTPPVVKPLTSEATVKPSATPPVVKPPTAEATVKPSATPPVVKPSTAEATVKPSATPPVVKPLTAEATVKPSATPPVVKPPAAEATVKPSATPPVVKPAPTTKLVPSLQTTAKPQTPAELKKLGIDIDAPQVLDANKFSKVQLKPGQNALYILRDAEGNILKVGKTSASAAAGRFSVYKRAGATQVEVYPLKPSMKKVTDLETTLRNKIEAEGHAMPWDNTPDATGKPRLGRSGFGTPGEGVRTPPVTKEILENLLRLHKGNRKEVGEALAAMLGRKSVHQRTVGMWAQSYGINTTSFK